MKLNRIIIFSAAAMLMLLFAIVMIFFFTITKRDDPGIRPSGKRMEPNDWMAMQRTYPYAHINPEAVSAAMEQVELMMKNKARMTTPWVQSGPTNIGGRITDVETTGISPKRFTQV